MDNDVLLTGFKAPIRYDRPNDAHGGVAVYIKESLYSKRRSDLEIRGVENIWIEVKLKHRSVLIGTFFRPPNSDVSILTDIEASIDLAFDSGIKDIIITGDFNFDYLKPTTRKKMDDITVQYNLHQIIEEVTNFTEHSASLIDICLVSDPSNVILSGVGIHLFLKILGTIVLSTVFIIYRKPKLILLSNVKFGYTIGVILTV